MFAYSIFFALINTHYSTIVCDLKIITSLLQFLENATIHQIDICGFSTNNGSSNIFFNSKNAILLLTFHASYNDLYKDVLNHVKF